ncbi:Chitinase A [Neolecta irregularis DAH-3]|uniref:Chitinase A n=1 Tax=Neolecta irregularis (strain DAH-3) TaxID=1198029 RepID=A0A1U7LKP5_NEOID|nr:Chitinase A [Neolecta irregularis DAH-3]|eukprot:OLL23208.1 Chitinase A [Neolecta irregularis DAH-3]
MEEHAIVAHGILTGPKYDQARSPWQQGYDEYSDTAYAWNRLTKQFIAYDDPTSLEAKVNYAKSIGSAASGMTTKHEYPVHLPVSRILRNCVHGRWILIVNVQIICMKKKFMDYFF